MIFDLYEVRIILCTSRTILYLLPHFWRECFANRLVSAWLSFRRGRHAADSESIFLSRDESKTKEGRLWKLEWCKHQMQYKLIDYNPLFVLYQLTVNCTGWSLSLNVTPLCSKLFSLEHVDSNFEFRSTPIRKETVLTLVQFR